jgi:hypothetical protein
MIVSENTDGVLNTVRKRTMMYTFLRMVTRNAPTLVTKEENMIALIIYAPVLVLITVETIVYYWQEADRRSTHDKI